MLTRYHMLTDAIEDCKKSAIVLFSGTLLSKIITK